MSADNDSPFARIVSVGKSFELRFSPDERSVVALGRNVVLWETGRKRRIASAHPLSHPSHVDFSPDGSRLLVKSTSGQIVVLDGRTLEVVKDLGDKSSGEGAPALFTADGTHFVEGSWSGHLLVRSVTTGEVVFHERFDGMIPNLVANADRTVFAYTCSKIHPGQGSEFRVRQWPFDVHDPATVFSIGDRGSSELAITGGGLAVALTIHHLLRVLSVEIGKPSAEATVPQLPRGLDWSPDGTTLGVALSGQPGKGRVVVFDADLNPSWEIDLPYASSIEWSPSGRMVAMGAWEHGLIGHLA